MYHACYLYFRIKIMQNIGVTFVKMSQYSDAVTSFEHIMVEKANFQAGKDPSDALCIHSNASTTH